MKFTTENSINKSGSKSPNSPASMEITNLSYPEQQQRIDDLWKSIQANNKRLKKLNEIREELKPTGKGKGNT